MTPKIDYTLKRRSRQKHIYIKIPSASQVIVSAPKRTPQKTIDTLIQEKSNWIQKQQEKLANTHPTSHTFQNGDTFLYLGQEKTLTIKPSPKNKVYVKYTSIIVESKTPTQEKQIAKQLINWIKEQGKDILSDRLHLYEALIGVSAKTIRFKNNKSRWGSCSTEGNINLNWTLVMAPIPVMDYVVIHELCHLIHPNHSKAFWQTVAQFCPQYLKEKTWLKINGPKIRIETP